MSFYDANFIITATRTMIWKFSDMVALVRKLTGAQYEEQLTTTEIKQRINDFYQNTLPPDLTPRALQNFYTFDTVANTDTYQVADGVVSMGPKFWLSGYPCEYTQDVEYFFGLFPETQTYTADRPSHVLHRGNLLIFRPKPDTIYAAKTPALIKPIALSLDADTPMQDEWGLYVCYGAALVILGSWGDTERTTELTPFFKYAKGLAQGKEISQLTQTERTKPRW